MGFAGSMNGPSILRAALAIVSLTLVMLGCQRRQAIEHYNRGIQHLQAMEYLQAVAEFQEALRLRPDFPEAHNGIGYAYNQLARYSEAIEHFQKAAEDEDYSQRHIAYLNLGTAYSNARQYDQAVAALQRSIELEPTAMAYYTLAQALTLSGAHAEALNALEEAVRLDPERKFRAANDPIFDPLRSDPGLQERWKQVTQ
ncbi:MAG: hypothetical protein KatS3mg115_1893 [Candidatus Poribacteria bacterium]|nr:MAG: hypothetical protein KatS3mg115_1893 [Candidatus Poribacteria bacterium]